MVVSELTNGEFIEFTKKGIVFVDFCAEWCMPCVMMAPVFDEISDKFKKFKFGKVNIDENKELASRFKVMSIPCLIAFKDGKEINRIIGSLPVEVLEERIAKLK